jgi:hypothetical protein
MPRESQKERGNCREEKLSSYNSHSHLESSDEESQNTVENDSMHYFVYK